MFADKTYLSKALLLCLWRQGLHLIAGIRCNMKNYLLPMLDKVLLRKRWQDRHTQPHGEPTQ
ncbi:MAG: hypothetical protein F4Z67_02215 [Synechococcus sp. SB0667_bin_8]|nr:hypothetical protein [Synechococcus sp. SB0667_bin_8]MYG63197.1 hypothetical protein [Synechococcus sp. SB0675_bin_7]MYK86498.1 hypothetical protein [Synechococcus sp. SB0669_bin_7]